MTDAVCACLDSGPRYPDIAGVFLRSPVSGRPRHRARKNANAHTAFLLLTI
jgi:hypothetical protein